MIYLDHAATTPLDPQALEEMLPVLRENFGNPSGLHCLARNALRLLEQAREEVAHLLGAADPGSIIWTSGGTESNNLALAGEGLKLVSQIEHKSVLAAIEEMDPWRPDPSGLFHAGEMPLRPETALVTVGLANNEIGTIQDIAGLARAAHQGGARFHCDAVAAVGKIPVDVVVLGVDSLSLSAHKFYGPKGIGALYVREPRSLSPLIRGGGQESGLRSGTQNVAGAVGLAAALRGCLRCLAEESLRQSQIRDRLWHEIQAICPQARRLGAAGLPNLLSVVLPQAHGESLALELSRLGVAVSSGSACSSLVPGPSHVLQALGIMPPDLHGHLRFSLGRSTRMEDIPLVVAALKKALDTHVF